MTATRVMLGTISFSNSSYFSAQLNSMKIKPVALLPEGAKVSRTGPEGIGNTRIRWERRGLPGAVASDVLPNGKITAVQMPAQLVTADRDCRRALAVLRLVSAATQQPGASLI